MTVDNTAAQFLTQITAPNGDQASRNLAAGKNGIPALGTDILFANLLMVDELSPKTDQQSQKEILEEIAIVTGPMNAVDSETVKIKLDSLDLSAAIKNNIKDLIAKALQENDFDGTVESALEAEITALTENVKNNEFDPQRFLITTPISEEGLLKSQLSEKQKDVYEMLEALIAGLPASDQNLFPKAEAKITLEKLLKASENIENELQSLQTDLVPAALIATGLSPQDLETLTKHLENSESAANENFGIFLVRIVPDQSAEIKAQQTPEASINKIPNPVFMNEKDKNEAANPAVSLAAKLNALLTNANTGQAIGTQQTEESLPERTRFDRVLTALGEAKSRLEEKGKDAPGLEKAIQNIKNLATVASENVNGTPPAVENLSFLSSLSTDIFPDGFDWSQTSQGLGQFLSLNSPSMLASMVTQGHQASQPHPATQQVAASITKNASSDDIKNITLRLDPPDLGKVEIRIEMGKDKTLKAHMIAEKPETFLMLQRDAQILEKALQESGLDASNSGLSFELADDPNFFDDGRNGYGGSNDSGGGDSNASDDEELQILEMQMDWDIDPDTGYVSYNILA